jgi:hypothetical protein
MRAVSLSWESTCFAGAFGNSRDSIFALGFQCFQQFRGICFLLEVSPRSSNYIGFWYSFGTARF